jgi:uncharacterized protein (DUF2235 family)
MGKNIVILFDGTSNQISENRTNILRLYGALEKSERQLVFYDPGVGTLGVADSWGRLWPRCVEIWGLVTGWGMDGNVKQAYRFLVENYERGAGGGDRDRIYLFGFSRGAYTARVLAGLINAVGLIEPRNLNLLDYVYRAYKLVGSRQPPDSDAPPAAADFAEVRLYERVLRPDRPPIRLLGLFDTVASVIESGPWGPRLRSHAYTRRNPSVEMVRHAVAMDERRTMFSPQLWHRPQAAGCARGLVRGRAWRCRRRLSGSGKRPLQGTACLDDRADQIDRAALCHADGELGRTRQAQGYALCPARAAGPAAPVDEGLLAALRVPSAPPFAPLEAPCAVRVDAAAIRAANDTAGVGHSPIGDRADCRQWSEAGQSAGRAWRRSLIGTPEAGDPYGNRTRVSAVRGPRPDR